MNTVKDDNIRYGIVDYPDLIIPDSNVDTKTIENLNDFCRELHKQNNVKIV